MSLIKSFYIVRWNGLFDFRNKESYKMFTDGIGNMVSTIIRGLVLKQDNTNYSDYDSGFVSFHVTDHVFMSFFEGFGLVQPECNMKFLKEGVYPKDCITAPKPGSSITVEVHKPQTGGRLSESWIRVLYNGEFIPVCE